MLFTPSVKPEARASEIELGDGMSRVILRLGFSESPDIPAALSTLPDADVNHVVELGSQVEI